MNTQNAYPLSWPISRPRTEPGNRRVANFGDHTVARAVAEIYAELKRLGVGDWNVVVSSNIPLRLDGVPRSDQGNMKDPGVAVYFKLKERSTVFACDKWIHVEHNLWAVAKHIEAMRGQRRWGVGDLEQQFAGYAALPPSGSSAGASWWNILGCAHDAPFDVVKEAYREKAQIVHPDNKLTGSHEAMVLLNTAWDQARAAFKQ